MNVIFLDIDGVLVSSRHLESNGDNRNEFDPLCVGLLNELLIETQATIVISSNWRRHKTLEELQVLFNENGVKGKIIGCTPIYDDFTIMRGQEIQDYLSCLTGTELEISRFVIFDDEENMLHLSPFYVQTDPRIGIAKKDIEKAKRMFG